MTAPIFITGSGTGVGKTLVTCALAHQLREKGETVHAVKPVLSGTDEGPAETLDPGLILQALGRDIEPGGIDEISPWRFRAALSPDMAAAREARAIDFDDLISFCRGAQPDDGALLIEGIGGAFVPLGPQHLTIDWIQALNARPVVVTGSYLGALSHTLATIEGMIGREVMPAALVISESEDSPVPLEETAESLRRFLPGLPVAILPRLSGAPLWENAPDLTGLVQSPDSESDSGSR